MEGASDHHPLHIDYESKKKLEFFLNDDDTSKINPLSASVEAKDETEKRNQVFDVRRSCATNKTNLRVKTSNLKHVKRHIPKSFSEKSNLVDNSFTQDERDQLTNQNTPAVADLLEMEDLPQHDDTSFNNHYDEYNKFDTFSSEQPICTNSGLLLTHRKIARENNQSLPMINLSSENNTNKTAPFSLRPPATKHLEMENVSFSRRGNVDYYSSSFQSSEPPVLVYAKRLFAFARLWVIFFLLVLLLGFGMIIHSYKHENRNKAKHEKNDLNNLDMINSNGEDHTNVKEQIFLLPLYNSSHNNEVKEFTPDRHGARRLLENVENEFENLRDEFEMWVRQHNKKYRSENEKDERFQIWTENHMR